MKKRTNTTKPRETEPIQLSVYVDPSLRRRLRILAAREERTASSIVTEAIEAHLRKAGV